ncbi:MAG: hypothetical protein ABIG61_09280 [Planctomycetota bacterium]
MRLCRIKVRIALTFIEILATVAVLAILVTIVVGVSNYVETQGKERLVASTIGVLETAMEQYYEYWDSFPFIADPNYDSNDLVLAIDANGTILPDFDEHDPCYASSEMLYYYLSRTTNSRKIIGSLSELSITNEDERNRVLEFELGSGERFSLVRFIDPWKTAYRYTYGPGDVFPLLRSAGPDRHFNTRDDLTGRDQ